MAHEISPICDFLFGLMRASLLTHIVDVELTVQMVKGIHMYRKDHTIEFMIFTPWSKKIIPFPSLRHKLQATKVTKEIKQHCHGTLATHFSSLPLP